MLRGGRFKPDISQQMAIEPRKRLTAAACIDPFRKAAGQAKAMLRGESGAIEQEARHKAPFVY